MVSPGKSHKNDCFHLNLYLLTDCCFAFAFQGLFYKCSGEKLVSCECVCCKESLSLTYIGRFVGFSSGDLLFCFKWLGLPSHLVGFLTLFWTI